MATPEALVKYYECLKDSFNKIQAKDNKTALVNAALRPKIREEFSKSKEVLVSYLNYIQVFTSIYSEKFNNICVSIICPLFRENFLNSPANRDKSNNANDDTHAEDVANLVHKAIKEILKTKPDLVEDYVHCTVKFFPSSYGDSYDTFINYFSNALEICSYIRGEPLTVLLAKVLDRMNPPTSSEQKNSVKYLEIISCTSEAYKLTYNRLDILEKKQLENVAAAILAAFSREFLVSENGDSLNYLILYISSLDEKITDLFINLLWATFTNPSRTVEEKRASVCFACSFISRANFVDINKVLNYLETAVIWCKEFILETQTQDVSITADITSETAEIYFSLVNSIVYLLTQRYRELYEKESIERLKKLQIDKLFDNPFQPFRFCDFETKQRFCEIAALYGISRLKQAEEGTSLRKKRKSIHDPDQGFTWQLPFLETNQTVPDKVKHLYRNYYNHRNFTVFRE